MSVTAVHKDPAARTMTITAEFEAPVERVWEMWADPRQLERWWGPPTHPATVVDHELRPGGTVSYFVTGPDGTRRSGWWTVRAVGAPRHLEFELHDAEIPTLTVRVTVEARAGGGTRMTVLTTFPSDQAMGQLLSIGFEEGMSTALAQLDDILREDLAP
jgi:uncharacterized protein YndB with AHSA1/START domain